MSRPPRKIVEMRPLKGFRLIIPERHTLLDLINLGIKEAGVLIKTGKRPIGRLPFTEATPKPETYKTGYFTISRRARYDMECNTLDSIVNLEDVKKDLEQNGFDANLAVKEFRHILGNHTLRWRRYRVGFVLVELDGRRPEELTREDLEELLDAPELSEAQICPLQCRVLEETVCELV